MLPILQIGPLAIQTPGLIILIGIWIGLDMSERQAKLFGLDGGRIFSLLAWMLGAGLIGARLVFAASQMAIFTANPLSLFSLSPQLLNLPGGLAAALGAGLAYGQRQKLPLWTTLDALSTPLAILAVASAVANFASGDAFGVTSNLPWAIDFLGARRHPSQIYETLAGLAAAALVWPRPVGRLDAWLRAAPGLRFWVFIAASALARLALEPFRAGAELILGQFHLAQVVSWSILALSLWQIFRRGWPAPKPSAESETIS